jgi:putative transposase
MKARFTDEQIIAMIKEQEAGEKLRDECLNEALFGTLRDARNTLEEWQEDCNWRRPHSALGILTPMEFLHRKAMGKMAA